MKNSVRLALVVLGLVALMLLPVLFFEEQINGYFDGEAGLRRIQSFGPWAWLVAILLIVSDLVLPMPSTTVIAGLGMIYGPLLGGIIGGVGSLLAGLVAYWGCRMLGRSVFDLLVGEANLERLASFFKRHGLWAIALSRWMPLLPEVLCCLAGMARMHTGPFLASLACGSLAMGFAFAFLGAAYLEQPLMGLIISALIPLALWPFLHRYTTRTEPVPIPVERGSGNIPLQ